MASRHRTFANGPTYESVVISVLDPIRTQVLVVGAGAAGISAAIAAARQGARTTLVEYHGFLGGISATLPWLGFHDRDYQQVVKGLPDEFVRRLQSARAASTYTLDIKCGSLVSVDSHMWKVLAMQLAREAGVDVMLHTHVVDALRDGDRVTGVVVEHKSGRQEIRAESTIDASGDGDVAARAGARWAKGRTADGLVQAPTLVFRLGGLDRRRFLEACKDPALRYREWIADDPVLWEKNVRRLDSLEAIVLGGFAGLIERARADGAVQFPQTRVVGVKTHRDDQLTVVMTRVLGLDPTDVASVSAAYAKLYAQVPELVSFFNRYVPGAEASYLLEIAPMLGVRESRRIVGEYVMTKEDVLEGRRPDDTVAMGGYHIDIHRPAGTWVESFNVQTYGIPLRSLIAADLDGLYMAGKCLSATHEAVASTRVIPICMAQGQAIGTAAGMAALSGTTVRSLDVAMLQDRLSELGAEIGRTLSGPDLRAIDEIGQLPLHEPPTTGDEDAASRGVHAWVR